jgi:hypothetical protein
MFSQFFETTCYLCKHRIFKSKTGSLEFLLIPGNLKKEIRIKQDKPGKKFYLGKVTLIY